MCELMGMSALRATDVNHSLELLQPRGGEIGPHADGWGVAFYEGRAARIFKEPIPACDSRCLSFIASHSYQSSVVVSHIRKANPARFGRSSANTHPFCRELGGRSWVFAHNGKLPGIERSRFNPRRFQPIGDTDSERAFCFLMDQVAAHWSGGAAPLPDRMAGWLADPIAALSELGILNMLLSDGDNLLVFANERLHCLHRDCDEGGQEQHVLMLATQPLTSEPWRPLDLGVVHVARGGRFVLPEVELAAAAR